MVYCILIRINFLKLVIIGQNCLSLHLSHCIYLLFRCVPDSVNASRSGDLLRGASSQPNPSGLGLHVTENSRHILTGALELARGFQQWGAARPSIAPSPGHPQKLCPHAPNTEDHCTFCQNPGYSRGYNSSRGQDLPISDPTFKESRCIPADLRKLWFDH